MKYGILEREIMKWSKDFSSVCENWKYTARFFKVVPLDKSAWYVHVPIKPYLNYCKV